MEKLLQDLRYSVRVASRNPGFTLIAVAVLAVGIGANTAVFSLVNALLFRPLEVSSPAQLLRIYNRDEKPDGGYRAFSYPNYVDLRAQNDAFSPLAAFTVAMVGITEGDTTRRAMATVASANYFATFGVRPILGRDFRPEEEQPGSGATVAIVSYSYWKRHGLDPAILGQTLKINGHVFEIVGVAPQFFTGCTVLFAPDCWVPLGVNELLANDFAGGSGRTLSDRGYHALMLLGRVRPGLTAADAEGRLAPLARRLAETYPSFNKEHVLQVGPLARLSISTNPQARGPGGDLAALVMPMSGVVLVIACLNLANMLLARSTARRREMAVRLALGGGRWRLIRQLLTEAFLLSFLGAAAGLLLATWATGFLASSLGAKISFVTIEFRAAPDVRVIGATVVFCVIATLCFALLPAWKLARSPLLPGLKDAAGDPGRSRRWSGLLAGRNLLVVGQVALSLMLLALAGLFYRGAFKAAHADPGFRLTRGLLVELDPSLAGLSEDEGRPLYQRVLERVRALPGVENASLASMVPFGMFADGRRVLPANATTSADAKANGELDVKPVDTAYVLVTPDYFRTLALPLLRGRDFERVDLAAGAGAVAIIDEPLGRRLWPGQDPVGRQIRFADDHGTNAPLVMEIVGVVPGIRQELTDREPQPRVYVPFGDRYQAWMNLHVRVASPDPDSEAALLREVRQAIREVDPRLPVLSATTLRSFHNEGIVLWTLRTGARLFLLFAGIAVFLAAVGVYGVKAFLVARRTREIGIRMALGASRSQVVWLILRDGLRLAGVGIAVGLLLALAAGQLVSSKLYEVSGADPLSFGVAMVVLSGAALLANYVPARRAAYVQPMRALREE